MSRPGKSIAISGCTDLRKKELSKRKATTPWNVDQRLRVQQRWVLLILLLGSVAVRAVYFVELNASPLVELHRRTDGDMAYYHAWGRAIADGDWLSRSIGVPMHTWHIDVADRFFADHPDARAALSEDAAARGTAVTPQELLWSAWNGPHQFYQDPLYAYLIGVTYKLSKPDPRIVLAWQLALGVASNVLIFLLARRYFGEAAGVVAGALALLCAPLMSYELLLLRDSTIVFAGLGLVWLADHVLRRQHWIGFAVLGLSLGLAMLLKSTFLLFAVMILGVIGWEQRRQRVGLVRVGAALAGGLAIALAPAAARNVAVGAPAMAWAGSGTLTFAAAGDISYPPTGGFYVNAQHLADVMGKSGGRFLPAALETIRAHTPATLATLVWHKVDNTWRWYEIPNMVSFYYMRRQAPVLTWLPVTFYVLGPLALVGLVLGLRHVDAWPLYTLVLCLFGSLVGFLVLGRLRAALLAAVIPFAALTIVTTIRARGLTRVASVIALALLALWTGRPLSNGTSAIPASDWLTPFFVRYQDQIKRAIDAGDHAGAAAAYGEFLRYEPDFSDMPRVEDVLATTDDRDTARTFARIHDVCAEILTGLGRPDEARAHAQRATALFALAGARGRG